MPKKRKEPTPPKDPANPSPTYGQHYPAQALRKEEIEGILHALRGVTAVEIRNRALVVTLWRAGLRISEALALRPTDFDGARNELRVLRGKGGKARTVAVDTQCSERISQWLGVRRLRWPGVKSNATVFCTRTGEPMRASYARDFLHQAAREAGIDRRVHPHAFRHTFTVELVREGVPMPMIQRLLGHSNLATTSTYVSSLSPDEAMAYVKGREW